MLVQAGQQLYLRGGGVPTVPGGTLKSSNNFKCNKFHHPYMLVSDWFTVCSILTSANGIKCVWPEGTPPSPGKGIAVAQGCYLKEGLIDVALS